MKEYQDLLENYNDDIKEKKKVIQNTYSLRKKKNNNIVRQTRKIVLTDNIPQLQIKT